MDTRPNTRRIDRQRKPVPLQPPRGAKPIVIPMTRPLYDEIWQNPQRVRAFLAGWLDEAPELFPAGFDHGSRLHGFGRPSRKLSGLKLRKFLAADGTSYWLRPSFIVSSMAGTTVELAYPLLLAALGVSPWLLEISFGHSEMDWYRLVERLRRTSLEGATVGDPARLPEHLAADEHHVDWAGQKGYVAMTVGDDAILGVALTDSADDHLRVAYGQFAAEAQRLAPEYAPRTVNTGGWAATRNAFASLFPGIAVILCFLHGFLKIRNRSRQDHELHRRVWDVYRAASADEFRRLMAHFQQWCGTRTWTTGVGPMLAKLGKKTKNYVVVYGHPKYRRASNMVDWVMNRLCRLMYGGRGLQGLQRSSELRLRGWELLLNFRPYAPRSNQQWDFASPAHRSRGKCYHEHWLYDLMVAISLLGLKSP